jgi:hypothetical protein
MGQFSTRLVKWRAESFHVAVMKTLVLWSFHSSLQSTKSVDGSKVRLSYNVTEETLTKVVGFLKEKGGDNVSKTEVFQLQKVSFPSDTM